MHIKTHKAHGGMHRFKGVCVAMDLTFLLVFSLLLAPAAPLGETNTKPCSSQIHENLHLQGDSAIHLPLHHVHGTCSPLNSKPSPVSDVLRRDQARVQTLISRLFKTNATLPESITVPLKPGHSIRTGNYIVTVGLGTPPKRLITVVDTGSSFSWVQCQPCVDCHSQVGPIFDPTSSQSYTSLKCRSTECSEVSGATLNPTDCSSDTCMYAASYGDGSFSIGALSKDTLTLAPAQTWPGFIYGCGLANRGLFGQSAGLIGLGRNKLSLFYQIAPKYGYVFSYCLPTPSSTGSLSFGAYNPSLYTFTPMLSNSRAPSLYFLKLTGITVSGTGLAVSPAEYSNSPTLIDSGTVITRLPDKVYRAMKTDFVKKMSGYTRASAFSILDTCFKGSVGRMSVPEVRLVFEGGSEMKLEAGNVLIDVDNGVTCLAFVGSSGIAIIGNHQQAKFRVVYDVSKSRIGFAAGGCG